MFFILGTKEAAIPKVVIPRIIRVAFNSFVNNLLIPAEAPNITERIRYWTYYTNRIFSSPKTFLVGHANRPDRAEHPSAHNYYLDLVYNFGFLSLLPILGLLVLTFVKVYTFRDRIFSNTGLTGLTILVLFLLLVDNSFKVGLRQPYPGIITFFLWGLLLNRLLGLKNIKDQNGT